MARRDESAWTQQPLIPNLVPIIKVELTVVLDGPRNEYGVGFRVRDHVTDEYLAMEATPINRGLDGASLAGSLAWAEAHRIARQFLSPF